MKQIEIMKDIKEFEDFLNEGELNESALRKLEKYSDQAWRKLDIEEKISALHAINASGSGQMVKLLNKTQL